MKSSAAILFILTNFVLAAGCQSNAHDAGADPHGAGAIAGAAGAIDASFGASTDPDTATLWVHGMACPQCANNVDLQLLKVPGVESVKVDMGSGRVLARLSPGSPPTRAQLEQAIRETGFTLKRIEMPG